MDRPRRAAACLFILVSALCAATVTSAPHNFNDIAPEFSQYKVVHPSIFHIRDKREVSTTREMGGGHISDITVAFNMNGEEYVMDLQLNRDLIPDTFFEQYQHNGKKIINRPLKETELCDYQGKVRGHEESWVALSTCDGLSGIIFDGKHLYYLEKGLKPNNVNGTALKDHETVENNDIKSHILYNHSHLVTNHTFDHHEIFHDTFQVGGQLRNLRRKRSVGMIQRPYNANKTSRYIELVLVVDNGVFKAHGERYDKVYPYCRSIANILNALYTPLNIFVALVGVEVWSEKDEINLSSNGDNTLSNFLTYRRRKLTKEIPNDNAQLLTKTQFIGGVIGKALKKTICTYEFSGGVNTDINGVVGLLAVSVAHMMGHNLGMEHDTLDCECPDEHCIMAPSVSSHMTTHWSSCSKEYLDVAFRHGMDYCLRNKPKSLFGGSVCGNGFVELGEQCDCGLPPYCDNPCCDATTCKLYDNATCATGNCCDFKTCHLMKGGTVCRTAENECDVPEYCTGNSEYCPDDVFKMDGELCALEEAYCYRGSCQTHTKQCNLLWGPTSINADMKCYELNNRGNRHGNCGFNRLNNSYYKCNDEDVYCGLLQCAHDNDRLEFGMESVSIVSQSFLQYHGSLIQCRTALVDLGVDDIDPGLVPNGAKCGESKMCVNQKCVSVSSHEDINACEQSCNGKCVCNSKGQCHCGAHPAPLVHDRPEAGGSVDTGPTSAVNGTSSDHLTRNEQILT